MDTYITIPVIASRQRLDALHAARMAAGLSRITDSQMLHILVQAGESFELECYAALAEATA